jgi:hypothetical protein
VEETSFVYECAVSDEADKGGRSGIEPIPALRMAGRVFPVGAEMASPGVAADQGVERLKLALKSVAVTPRLRALG